MDPYVTGTAIRRFREKQNMTQAQLAQKLCVSDKAVSKWETGNGYPDITLLEPLAQALGISVIALLSGNCISNVNRAFNMLRVRFYVCPVCGNVICATGDTVVSCCGITLPALEAEPSDSLQIEVTEDEYFITIPHDMTKAHYISFMAAVSDDGVQIVKLYPEENAQARFKVNRTKHLYYFCNRHGLYVQRIAKRKR